MPVTLTEAEKFTTNFVKKGVLREIIKDSVILQKLPFIDVVGNALQYLVENTLPTAQFYDPNEAWVEGAGTWLNRTAVIKILGGDADVDNFLQKTRSNGHADLKAETIIQKAKAVKHTFLDRFYYGDIAGNSKEFDGLHKIMAGFPATQTINQSADITPDPLSMDNLDELFDRVLDGVGDCFIMPRKLRKRINQFLRGPTGGNLHISDRNAWGNVVQEYNGVGIYTDDFLSSVELLTAGGAYSAKTGGTGMSIFYLRFGPQDLTGLQSGGLETIPLGQLESKDATRTRIRWYPSIACLRTISIARIVGISDAVAVA